MPDASLPTHWKGWIVALVASFIGFVSGFVTIAILGGMINGG